MNYNYLQKSIVKKAVLVLLFGLIIFSCRGVHNEPPSEVIRTSGSGPTSRTAPTNGQVDKVAADQTVLDSSGNPIETSKK